MLQISLRFVTSMSSGFSPPVILSGDIKQSDAKSTLEETYDPTKTDEAFLLGVGFSKFWTSLLYFEISYFYETSIGPILN